MSKVSETKTENIFREKYGPNVFIEKSAIPSHYGFKSKKGTDFKGFPDFFLDQNDFVIVVEAKAKDHKSAEDEVKFYIENNRITKDIIGVAVSGQSSETLKVSYFFKEANSSEAKPIVSVRDVLLSLENIYKQFRKVKSGELLSSENLVSVLKALNNKFHKRAKVRDTERSLFFSGIMIALNSLNFRNTYKKIAAPSEEEISTTKATVLEATHLNNLIVSSIEGQLNTKINNLSKEYSWKDKFSFIKNIDYPLNEYQDLIEIIETKVFNPFKNEEKQDILGRAYKIFLSRAGKAENKNIILTPDHIKELMIKLARLNSNDVFLDTCTGSGGFLMEAMEVMIGQCHGDENKIKSIKEKQLIGFELDPVLFALACSNMFLHGDGKSNILFRSSLLDLTESKDKKVFEYIKGLKPTKVVINPPYESDGSIKFTKQAIDFLETNGKLITVMPTNTLIKNQGGITDEILKIAKLDFVIKMPDNLFSEQERGVNTSIFGFTKTPQDKKDDVLFYELNDDGFVSVQHKGKLDVHKKWVKIEEGVLDSVLNLKEVPDFSTKKKIYTDEGVLQCAGILKVGKSMAGYKLVKVKDLFDISKGELASSKSEEIGEYNFITAAEEWKKHTSYTHDTEALVYAVGSEGSLGRCHYVNGKFIASNLCLILKAKNEEYPLNMEFYQHYLNLSRSKIVKDLSKGASKKTIGKDTLEDYYIEYVPLDIQKSFLKKHVSKVEKLKEQIKSLENDLAEELKTQEAMFHCFKYEDN